MKNEKTRAVISVIVFAVCLALTFPFVSGFLSFTSMKENLIHPETEQTAEETEDPYDPFGPGGLFDTTAETQEPVSPDTDLTTSVPEETTAPDDTENPVETAVATDSGTAGETASETVEIQTDTESTSEIVTEPAETEPITALNYPWLTVDKSYFDDALFVGDSRTARMMLTSRGLLDTAHFFAGEGWSCKYAMNSNAEDFTQKQLSSDTESKVLPMVYTGADENGKLTEIGRYNFEDLLKTGKYKKIYIMFGINEIGGSVSGIYNNVAKMITMCQSICPDSIVFVEGNLLMTEAYSNANKYGKNPKLLEINAKLSTLANWKNILYIDINDLMGDGKGNASTEYSDGAHQKWANGSKIWAEWLYTKGYNPEIK